MAPSNADTSNNDDAVNTALTLLFDGCDYRQIASYFHRYLTVSRRGAGLWSVLHEMSELNHQRIIATTSVGDFIEQAGEQKLKYIGTREELFDRLGQVEPTDLLWYSIRDQYEKLIVELTEEGKILAPSHADTCPYSGPIRWQPVYKCNCTPTYKVPGG